MERAKEKEIGGETMTKTLGLGEESKRFNGEVYRYFHGLFPNKTAAQKQAKILRSKGRLARVTKETYRDWVRNKPEVHWIVWMR